MLCIWSLRLYIPYAAHRIQHCCDDQNAEEEQKERGEHFADPDEDAGGAQGEIEDNGEEAESKYEKTKILCLCRNKRRNTDLKGDRGCSRNRKKRTDAQIEEAGECIGKAASDLCADIKETLARGNADCSDGEKRQPHTRSAESDECWQHRCACTLTHGCREDQIACAEDKSEEHRGNEDIFLLFQPSFHLQNLSIK